MTSRNGESSHRVFVFFLDKAENTNKSATLVSQISSQLVDDGLDEKMWAYLKETSAIFHKTTQRRPRRAFYCLVRVETDSVVGCGTFVYAEEIDMVLVSTMRFSGGSSSEKLADSITEQLSNAVQKRKSQRRLLSLTVGELERRPNPLDYGVRSQSVHTLLHQRERRKDAIWGPSVTLRLRGAQREVRCSVHLTSIMRVAGKAVPIATFPYKERGITRESCVTLPLDLSKDADLSRTSLWAYFFYPTETDDGLHSCDQAFGVVGDLLLALLARPLNAYRVPHIVNGKETTLSVSFAFDGLDAVDTSREAHISAIRNQRTVLGKAGEVFRTYTEERRATEKQYSSNVHVTSGETVTPQRVVDVVYSPMIHTPTLFFFIGASQLPPVEYLSVNSCNALVENWVRIVCWQRGLTVTQYLGLGEVLLSDFLVRVVILVGSLIAYTPDTEGDYFCEPQRLSSLARAQADCEDLAALCIHIVSLIQERTTSSLTAPLRQALSSYCCASALISSKGYGQRSDGSSNVDAMHQVAVLIPLAWMEALTIGKSPTSETRPQLLECMANVQSSEAMFTGTLDEDLPNWLWPYTPFNYMRNQRIYGDLYRLFVPLSSCKFQGEYIAAFPEKRSYGMNFVDFLETGCTKSRPTRLVRLASVKNLQVVQEALFDETFALENLTLRPRDIATSENVDDSALAASRWDKRSANEVPFLSNRRFLKLVRTGDLDSFVSSSHKQGVCVKFLKEVAVAGDVTAWLIERGLLLDETCDGQEFAVGTNEEVGIRLRDRGWSVESPPLELSSVATFNTKELGRVVRQFNFATNVSPGIYKITLRMSGERVSKQLVFRINVRKNS